MFNTPWIDCDVITGSPLSYLENNMILEYILHMQLVLWSKFHWFLMTKSGFICVEMKIFAQSSTARPFSPEIRFSAVYEPIFAKMNQYEVYFIY